MVRTSPRVFVSYSRHSEQHVAWVRRLAEDLRTNGVDAVLDQWDLRLGEDLTRFMVDEITAADHVLLVCTKSYGTRARADRGGVAFEHYIISGAIHTGAADPRKFLPILREGDPSDAIPGYLQSRVFSDFRDDRGYAHGLDGLLRFLFNAPVEKPGLGRPPSFGSGDPRGGISHPVSWVLVAGTGRASAMDEKIRATSERLGQVLAREGYGLVTGGWAGVDEVCARAFSRAMQQRRLPLENFLSQVVNQQKDPAFPAGKLTFVSPGEAEWTESIGLADIVVLIGGLGGTFKTGKLALEQGKLVLPLADTGSDAMKMFMEMSRAPEKRGIRLRGDQLLLLGREAPDVVDTLVELLR